MHFSSATIVAALAANVLAIPVPQIGGEAQFCQNVANGVTNGVGQGTEAALNNVAGTISKGAKLRLRMYRRQGTGAADACYDIVNNVDQGSGYTIGNVLDGASGNEGSECTGDCAVGNTGGSGGAGGSPPPPPPPPQRRQVANIMGGVQSVAGAAGAGQVTAPVTDAASGAASSVNGAEDTVGAKLGTIESAGTADAGAQIGNAIGSALHGGNSKRQLNKIAAGQQNAADSVGLGDEVQPLTDAEDNIDGTGTGSVGNLGGQIGSAIQGALVGAGQSVPKKM